MKIKQITSNHQQLCKDDNVIVTMSGGNRYNEFTNGSYHKITTQMMSENLIKVLVRTHKFGVRIPKGIYEAWVSNTANGDTIWWFAICKEVINMDENYVVKIRMVAEGKSVKFILI